MHQRVYPESNPANIPNLIQVEFESQIMISDVAQNQQVYLVGKINLENQNQEFLESAARLSEGVDQIEYNVGGKEATYKYSFFKTYKAKENKTRKTYCKYETEGQCLKILLDFNPLFQHFEYQSQNIQQNNDKFLRCSSSFRLIPDQNIIQQLQPQNFRFRFYTNIKTWEKNDLNIKIGQNQLDSIKWTLEQNQSLNLELKFTGQFDINQSSGILYSRIIVQENRLCIAQAHKKLSSVNQGDKQENVLKFNFQDLKDCPPLYFGNHIQSHHIVIISLKTQRHNCCDIFKKNEFTIQVPVDLFPDSQIQNNGNINELHYNLGLLEQVTEEDNQIRLDLTKMFRFRKYFHGIKLLSQKYVDRQEYI